MSDLVDPAPDPAFPNRPDHPHFRGLSKAVQALDAYGEEGETVVSVLQTKAGFDPHSALYMARQRAIIMYRALHPGEELPAKFKDVPEAITMSATTWLDGFLAGLMTGDGRSMVEAEQVLAGFEDGNRRKGDSHG